MYARDMARIATPVGSVTLRGGDTQIDAIEIGDEDWPHMPGASAAVRAAVEQLQAWFAGERTAFEVPLAPAATVRGQALRDAMCAIDYGETMSYGALAMAAGSSARAIGQVCARNPFPILVPCHRVLNADGTLGAYSAGAGSRTKAWLLDFEARGRRTLL
ncbi:methylated-DNA--[protein]-cysteine S-methyltransferase [Sphingomonas sp. PAMC 26617]|uniref:methylated-DNA--[protein]-cysteine S-methyltransferase n=1 Tax=Sphingomonas sp. PAMC 26617 TaxID=1112216 RepID=UPI000287A93A|nr:methylated-DNA--[protein]-cysteine S-methyltransferase [Sphingomonas sp. PAMC 26617]